MFFYRHQEAGSAHHLARHFKIPAIVAASAYHNRALRPETFLQSSQPLVGCDPGFAPNLEALSQRDPKPTSAAAAPRRETTLQSAAQPRQRLCQMQERGQALQPPSLRSGSRGRIELGLHGASPRLNHGSGNRQNKEGQGQIKPRPMTA
jgi:hypothetical protein